MAEMDERVKGLVLLDPVDNTSMTPPGAYMFQKEAVCLA